MPTNKIKAQSGTEFVDGDATPGVARVIFDTDDDLLKYNTDGTVRTCLAVGASVGASATPESTSTANTSFLKMFFETTATSGDARGEYLKLVFAGAGGSGEAFRAYSNINNVTVATGGTVNGAHITLDTTGASAKVSGQASALRATFGIAAATTALGGTCAVQILDTDIKTGATVPTGMSYIRFQDLGDTGLAYLFKANVLSTTLFANAGTGANSAAVSTGGVAAKVLKVSVNNTDYWLPLFSSNS
jgi:hypothetical protein